MRKAVVAMILFCTLALGLWAGAQTEKAGPAAVTQGKENTFVVLYANPAEYEKKTGKKVGSYKEAPQLAEMVKAGKLPSVGQRLPQSPMVVQPKDTIGTYGGVLRTATLSVHTGGPDARSVRMQAWFAFDHETHVPVPNIAEGWQISDDKKSLTIQMRKGMKWSDGVDFTTEDIKFWYEDVLLNKELTPTIPSTWQKNNKPPKLVVNDKYSFTFQFEAPYPAILAYLAADYNQGGINSPKHYLQKWHIRYNKDAEVLAKQEGVDQWWQAFQVHAAVSENQQDPSLPTLTAWVMYKIDEQGNKYFSRNPYFYAVDVEGNQLPYIDEQQRIVVKTTELMDLKLMAGELDLGGTKQSFDQYPAFKENEKSGVFRAVLLDGDVRTEQGITLNLWHKDAAMRALFRDVRFREAFSIGFDRNRLNETLYAGLAKPWTANVSSKSPLFEDWMGTYKTEYDPDRAAKLLDEIGLKWDKDHKWRLLPDGRTLTINIEYVDLGSGWKERLEMKQTDWQKLGIQVLIKGIDRSLYYNKRTALDLDAGVWNNEMEESDLHSNVARFFMAQYDNNPWSVWILSNGEKGEKPPEDFAQFASNAWRWTEQLPGTSEYERLGKEVLSFWTRYIYSIGDLVDGPQPATFNAKLKNTPSSGPLIYPGQRFWKFYKPYQWSY